MKRQKKMLQVAGEAKPLESELSMRITAARSTVSRADRNAIELMKDDKEFGAALAATIGQAIANIRHAYPGTTGRTAFTNQEWRDAGYDIIADENEALGLKAR